MVYSLNTGSNEDKETQAPGFSTIYLQHIKRDNGANISSNKKGIQHTKLQK